MNFRCNAFLSIALMLIAVASSINGAASEPQVRIGSKKFTESVILAEIAAKLCGIAGAEVIKHQELGGTRLLWDALVAGEIDLYPEYKGTLAHEILKSENIESDASLAGALAKRGLRMSESLGFSNRYAFGMMQVKAENLQIRTISDLTRHPTLRFGLSDEFLNRSDGWPALRIAYGLSESNVRGIDHEIAYKGLVDGSIDVIDLYTTDAEINLHKILIVDDERHYFSDNQAILIYRADLD